MALREGVFTKFANQDEVSKRRKIVTSSKMNSIDAEFGSFGTSGRERVNPLSKNYSGSGELNKIGQTKNKGNSEEDTKLDCFQILLTKEFILEKLTEGEAIRCLGKDKKDL